MARDHGFAYGEVIYRYNSDKHGLVSGALQRRHGDRTRQIGPTEAGHTEGRGGMVVRWPHDIITALQQRILRPHDDGSDRYQCGRAKDHAPIDHARL